jgi:hypothetical protein
MEWLYALIGLDSIVKLNGVAICANRFRFYS